MISCGEKEKKTRVWARRNQDCMQIKDTGKRGLSRPEIAQAYMCHSVLAAAVVVRISRHHAALNR